MTEHAPRITDDQVAGLPIDAGRADLLEEIMSMPVDQLDRTADRRTGRARRGPAPAWLAVPAAAAAIAAIALVPALRSSPDEGAGEGAPVAASTPSPGSASPTEQPQPEQRKAPSVPGGEYVALNAEGWAVTYVYEGSGETDIAYQRGDQSFEMVQYPASSHDSYYEDRMHVSEPAPTRLLGLASSTFTYSADDHATIRPAEGARFLEVRGTGMGLAEYRSLLDQVVQTDQHGLASAMPEGVVTPYDTKAAVARLLTGVDVPEGFTAADVDIEGFNDAYQSAAKVAGSVGCAWLDVYAYGGAAGRQRALAAFEGSTTWPLLRDTVEEGDYAPVFWAVADKLRRGDPVEQLRPGIC